MAVVERTIIAGGGGDYTTIAAWETATNYNSDTDIWKGVISDNSEYDENVTLNAGGGGTRSVNSHLWLTVAPANRHAGVWDNTKARLNYSGAATAALQADVDWVRIDWMQIARSGSSANSDEAIRVDAVQNVLVDYCILWSETSYIHGDGVYCVFGGECSVSNSVIYGWGRAGLHHQRAPATVINSDHNTVILCGTDGGSDDYGIIAASSDAVATTNAYNTIGCDNVLDGEEWYGRLANPPDSFDINGSHNVATSLASNVVGGTNTTINATDWVLASNGVQSVAPATAGVYITDDTIATLDATPVDHPNNVLLGNGTNRIGSEPDSRQDFSVDITGATRPTTNVDIGAFQISSSGGDVVALGVITTLEQPLSLSRISGEVTTELATIITSEQSLALSVVISTTIVLSTIATVDLPQTLTSTVGGVVIPLGVITTTDTPLALDIDIGGVVNSLDTITTVDTPLGLTVSTGGVTVNLSVITTTDTPLTLTNVIGGNVIQLGVITTVDTPLALTVDVPGSTTIPLGVITTIDTPLTLVIDVGGVSVQLGVIQTIDIPVPLAVVAGGTSVVLDTIVTTDTPLLVSPVIGGQTIALGVIQTVDTPLVVEAVQSGSILLDTLFTIDTPLSLNIIGDTFISLDVIQTVDIPLTLISTVGGVDIPLSVITTIDTPLTLAIDTTTVVALSTVTTIDTPLILNSVSGGVLIELGTIVTIDIILPLVTGDPILAQFRIRVIDANPTLLVGEVQRKITVEQEPHVTHEVGIRGSVHTEVSL